MENHPSPTDLLFDPARRRASVEHKTKGSKDRWLRAQASLAGGVSSSMRRSAQPWPLYFTHGRGAEIYDVDGNSYLDYTLAWGPNILGHTPPEVVQAIAAQAARGLTFGAQHELEYEVAERLVKMIPCAGRVCFSGSGTEIVQLALRLARAATGREKFIKFVGHYHGWMDSVLASYHPNAEQLAGSNGHPIGIGDGQLTQREMVIAEWNDPDSVERAFDAHKGEIGALICEPLLANSGCIEPQPGFLAFLREITERNKALLIFDEVITGFRLALGGAQEYFGVTPELATYAKAVGAGTTLSVLAGKTEYMEWISSGRVVHAGTLNGNPLSLAAAKAALDLLAKPGTYTNLHARGERLRDGLADLFRDAGCPVVLNGCGPVFQLSFMQSPARHYRERLANDDAAYAHLAMALLDEGVMVLPDGRWYVSVAHDDAGIENTLAAAARACGAAQLV